MPHKRRKHSKRTKNTNKDFENRKKSSEIVTGTWSWEGDEITFFVDSNNTSYKTYFGIGQGGSLKNQQGFADSNNNGIYDPGVDLFVGTGTHTGLISDPGSSGPFTADTGTGLAKGFKGEVLAGTIQNAGYWFL